MKRDELITRTNMLGKNVFTIADLKKLFPDESNIKHSIKRMNDACVITRVAQGLYRQTATSIDIEKVATQLYCPSYISFESILSRHGVINQGSYRITLATTRHSKKMILDGVDCEYSQLKQSLFFGFQLLNGVYVADVEKALLDEVYLILLGKRAVNTSEWNTEHLNKNKIKEYLPSFPQAMRKMLSHLKVLE